ncbi:threonine--tRNA ligase [Occultella kanbiaonis]|uniref:threonine--tRNA ligase n=1 Tax=Occultella kanbiaonis TaxID=2675754 RepID=UPI0012B6F1BD|nr:threonine--tRNA ligase [Occultella kanbiaonis]
MSHDHRVLGRRLDLFDTTPAVGAGLPLWLPDGAVIRGELEAFALEEALASGCRRIYTPVLAKRELFERSGHWHKFSADMFPEMIVGGESFVLRPANCPHHTQVFAAREHSYRDLPVGYAELGSMFRSELSGVLGGLSRVRQINLDDAHVFARPDQVGEQVRVALAAIRRCYDVLGIEIDHLRLSVRGPGGAYLGGDAQWERAEGQLREALDGEGLEYELGIGEAAFYGPKVDVQVRDAAGREETLSTVQVDHNLPERFDLTYIGPDGRKHRPVLIHRGLLSSMERMTALLLERHDGRLPTWLAPVQVRLLPVAEHAHGPAALRVLDLMRGAGIRAEVSVDGALGARIRAARERREPYLAVLGDSELDADALTVSAPGSGARATIGVAAFIASVTAEVGRRSPAAALDAESMVPHHADARTEAHR